MEKQCIYSDQDCMMCNWYTQTMLDHGLLSPDGRKTYTELRQDNPANIDTVRARNEIALVDERDGTVRYGVDSFLRLFAQRWPRFQNFFENRWLRTMAYPVYKFISYNRKVISPPPVLEQEGSCTPDFHLGYRWAYLLLTGLVSLVVTGAFLPIVLASTPAPAFIDLGAVFVVAASFQALIVGLVKGRHSMEYLGNLMTIHLLGALSLLPSLLFDHLFGLPQHFALLIVFVVILFMSWQHHRRLRYLELPSLLNVSWCLLLFTSYIIIL